MQERLALVEDVTLRDRLAPLLEMDASKRMQAFADFVIAEEVEEAPLSAYEFKATSFIPGEPTHALVIPLVDPDLPPISRSTSRFSRPSSRRTSPTRSRRTSRSRAASRASSPNRVSSYETLTLLGANDTPMPPSPLRLAFANPHSYSTKRALSFFKYALRCAGVLYRVVPRSEDGETVREYALVLECAATLHSSSTPAQQRLATLRPPLLRSATSRSSSLPPPRPVEEKVKVRCLPFYLGILVRTSQPTPSPPLLDTSPEMRKRRRGKSSRAPSPGAPAGFLVHVSDVRAMELVTEALSVGGEEGRGRSEPAAEELTDKLNSLGLRTGARSRSVPRPSMTA